MFCVKMMNVLVTIVTYTDFEDNLLNAHRIGRFIKELE